LLKKESETGNHETKRHKSQARADPGKQRSFGREIIAQAGGGLHQSRSVICANPP
jgi:hypothetical protein